jgi:LEA14-like dessication related protein
LWTRKRIKHTVPRFFRLITDTEPHFFGQNPIDTQDHASYIPTMKKQNLIILFALSVLLVSCLSWVMEEPSIVLREINLRPRSLTEINLLLGLDVQNPNRFDLTLKTFEYTVYLNNEKIGNGRLEKELLIPASSTTRVQAPVVAEFKDWGKSLKTIINGDNLPYKIEGKAVIKTAFGCQNFPFSKEGHIKN